MARGHGERRTALRENAAAARSASVGSRLRAAAVPNPHSARPQQSSTSAGPCGVPWMSRRLTTAPSGAWAFSRNCR